MLELVRRRIEDMSLRPARIAELALLAGMGETKLKAAFKLTYGTTLHQYSLKQRMAYAKRLIDEDHKSLAQIASLAGFSATSNFISAFKKYYGETPGRTRPR